MIQTNQLISYFLPPIAPVKDEQGSVVRPATMKPTCSFTLEQIYQLVTSNQPLKRLTQEIREAPDLGLAKRTFLPYITPFGTFSHRRCNSLLAFSGLLPIDVDKLESGEEAEHIKQSLFGDPYLDTRLVAAGVRQSQRQGCESFHPLAVPPPHGGGQPRPSGIRLRHTSHGVRPLHV